MATESVSGVLLAAGPSRRFGDDPPKQLVEIDGEPLVRRIALRALGSRLSQVIVVTGWAADRVTDCLLDLDVEIVLNRNFISGQSSSVKAGLACVRADAAGAMFIPVDQPMLTVEVIDGLVDLYLETGGPIVVPTYRGRRGAPVLMARRLFAELARISGDAGGRQLFPARADEIVELALSSSAPLEDVDRREDLIRRES